MHTHETAMPVAFWDMEAKYLTKTKIGITKVEI
jgi:hypothetical protein